MSLKLFVHSESLGDQLNHELSMYKRISGSSSKHPGRGAVRELLDSFNVAGPDGSHQCLVHPPLWESVLTFLHRNPVRRLPAPVLAFVLRRLFLALDFLHTECQIIHTGTYEGRYSIPSFLSLKNPPTKNGTELLRSRY